MTTVSSLEATTTTGSRAASADRAPQRRRHGGRVAQNLLYGLGVVLIIVYCLAPFYWMIVSSLRRPSDIFSLTLLPDPISFENYATVFSSGFLQSLGNSLIVAGITTVLALVIATTASYALARLRFRGKKFLLSFVIAASMFPIVALLVPLLRLFTDIGWINTYQAMILPSLSFALPLAVYTLTSFFRQMPVELEQAAMIDGCTKGKAFRLVILPIAAPAIFTTAIITFIAAWNEFIIALSVTNDPAIETAPVAISKFTGYSQFDQPFGAQMAAGVIVTIPLVIIVILFQRRIVAGLAAGGVK